jgi:hypothetical protein
MGLTHFHEKTMKYSWLKIGFEMLQKPCLELVRRNKWNKFIKMSDKQKDFHYIYRTRNESIQYIYIYIHTYTHTHKSSYVGNLKISHVNTGVDKSRFTVVHMEKDMQGMIIAIAKLDKS